MSKMISVASGFQYSVNIGYDLNNDDKLKNFIPTRSALELLEDILLSTRNTSTDRARVLIGAYGKGKSHIVLTIMAMLMKRDLSLFEKTLPMLEVLNMERSTYYDRKKEAILLFGLSLWGTAIPKLKDFLESAREEEALCYCEC